MTQPGALPVKVLEGKVQKSTSNAISSWSKSEVLPSQVPMRRREGLTPVLRLLRQGPFLVSPQSLQVALL